MAKRVGPAYLFLGNPTTAAGAGMIYLGETRGDVTVTPNVTIAVGRTDQKGSTPLADSVYSTGPAPVVSAPLLSEAKDVLKMLLPGSSVTGGGSTALGLGSGFAKIPLADIMTLCILPIDQAAQGTNGINAPDAIWIPAAIAREFGALTFNLPEGDDVFNPHETQFAGLYREKDHGDKAIPAAARVMFIGPPSAYTLTWNLPAVP